MGTILAKPKNSLMPKSVARPFTEPWWMRLGGIPTLGYHFADFGSWVGKVLKGSNCARVLRYSG